MPASKLSLPVIRRRQVATATMSGRQSSKQFDRCQAQCPGAASHGGLHLMTAPTLHDIVVLDANRRRSASKERSYQPQGHTRLRVSRVCSATIRMVDRIASSSDVAPGLAPQITADPTRLRQVLLNLLGNAVKFTARGSIELRLLPVPDQARRRIEVVDTGPGIPHDQRHLLFQDFERLEADVTASIEGAGLGLAVSARLAALMGGRIGHVLSPARIRRYLP